MKITNYLKDKFLPIFIYIINILIITMLLIAFKSNESLILVFITFQIILVLTLLLIEYSKKNSFYKTIQSKLINLDKKYLVLEMLDKPKTTEEELIYQIFYDINKSYIEELKDYKLSLTNFKEYIELWIHEVKIPISSLVLMTHNSKETLPKKYTTQIDRLDNYIDQVLYYVRSNTSEEDFFIKEVSLQKIITSVALKNKDDLLENNIEFIVKTSNEKVLTDEKWLEFILNQIINNSIKYKRNIKVPKIEIKVEEATQKVILTITDNGIGIPKNDLPKVFNKSFTGTNGRTTTKSTGLGLYIAKNLLKKLGHKIEIESEVNKYTKVTITFSKNNYYKIEN
ncbi:ATP-binding protein [uncultured Psychrobacillus sp.]|uniref:ATP-binding protein n=1 Tax=uncultured Psychrobacillus sp. TaxID=1551585 RepID=UPI002622EC0C|nr:ATP-binding protein [uncultured Psychrobacillus sp.]